LRRAKPCADSTLCRHWRGYHYPLFHAHRSVPPARAGDVIGRSSDSWFKCCRLRLPEISSV